MRVGGYARREREQAIAGLSRAGVPLDTIRAALRDARTLARLAEAQCNGDWPADNGEREATECGVGNNTGLSCGSYWAPQVLRGPGKLCPDCRAGARITAKLQPWGRVELQGDPRGYVAKLILPDGREVGLA